MISVYIHIPFCTSICSYCDFCKLLKNNNWIDKYLDSLEKEIKSTYKNETVKTLYIGGGTPSSLNLNQLNKLFEIIKLFNITKDCEISFEANSEDLTQEKIDFLKNKINRLSIGVQTFNEKYLKILNRKVNIRHIKNAIKEIENVNLDLMYGFNGQTKKQLKEDLKQMINLNPKHISTYSLILEENTKLYIDDYKTQNEDQEANMYEYITKTLKENNYIHYELSNFSKNKYQSKHNLTYWNNENYYGFGLGASGYLNNKRYENTRSLTEYLKGNYINISSELDLDETFQNEFILGLRKIEGLKINDVNKKYNINILEIDKIKNLINKKIIIKTKNNIMINPKYLYTSNEVLINFIDLSLHKH